MKIKSIKEVGHQNVFDLSILSDDYNQQHYILENGVVSHNTGIYYSANDIWIIGRRQNKKGTEVTGYDFTINIEKSRSVKEKSKIPISVSWDGGVEKYSGLLDVAIEGGYVAKPSNGWYCYVNRETGELEEGVKVREADTLNEKFWKPIFDKTDFKTYISETYKIGGKNKTIEELSEDEVITESDSDNVEE